MQEIEQFIQLLRKAQEKKHIHLVSHFDTDGITSGAILSKMLERMPAQFSMKILKQLTKEEIKNFPNDALILMCDLGSGSLKELGEIKNEVFIVDHHELSGTVPDNVHLLNPHCFETFEDLCSAELTYLCAKEMSIENVDLAYLSIIGMIGDLKEQHISKIRNTIIQDAQVVVKRGLMLYPSTRPLDKTLEHCARPFIPGVTGNPQGTYELLQEAGIQRMGKTFKALIDLNEEEMKNLTTAVTLRLTTDPQTHIGNLYLLKFFSKIEDVRELSAMINACSRMDNPEVALMFCLGNMSARKKAERIYYRYRQQIITALKNIAEQTTIQGENYVIINAKETIRDSIIGTVASILSFSSTYSEGTIIIAMAYNGEKIKVSTRIAGRKKKTNHNLKELMNLATHVLKGESGGHEMAAGCTIDKEHEAQFIELMQKKLEVELVKV